MPGYSSNIIPMMGKAVLTYNLLYKTKLKHRFIGTKVFVIDMFH